MAEKSAVTEGISEEQVASMLLNREERMVIEQIATGKSPWNQRARALLAMDEGATDADAGAGSGLRPTQVNYWLRKFQQDGLNIFPKDITPELDIVQADAASIEEPPLKEKKSKKSRKSKKTKGKANKSPKKKKGKKKKGGKGKKKKGKKK